MSIFLFVLRQFEETLVASNSTEHHTDIMIESSKVCPISEGSNGLVHDKKQLVAPTQKKKKA
jgi:hypothetical protein